MCVMANTLLILAPRRYFIKEGRVSESGTHDQLLEQRGDYYEYVQLQALSKK
jgi:ATP-binding cassette subfamily B (MDR/TAP) protein 1